MEVAKLNYTKLQKHDQGNPLKRRMAKVKEFEDISEQLSAAEDGPKDFDNLANALCEGGAGSSVRAGDYVFEVKAL
jgi:hypothetical protein